MNKIHPRGSHIAKGNYRVSMFQFVSIEIFRSGSLHVENFPTWLPSTGVFMLFQEKAAGFLTSNQIKTSVF